MASLPSAEKKTSVKAIPANTLLADRIVDFPIYYKNRNNQFKKLVNTGAHYPLNIKKQLEEKGIGRLYIRNSDNRKYLDYLQKLLTAPSEEDLLSKAIAEMKEISVKSFKAGTTVEFPLYFRSKGEKDGEDDKDETIKQLLAKGKILEASHLKMLDEKKINRLLIQKKDRKFFRAYVQQNTPPFTLEPGLKLEEKSDRIYGHGLEMIDYFMSEPRSGWGYTRVKVIVDHIVELVCSNDGAFKTLLDSDDLEYALSAHSLNVALFSIGFGLHLGFNASDLLRIGYSSVFHDIGKSQIDSELIDKADSLNREEFEVIKKHAKYGGFIMRSHLERDKDILDGVLYHHEHFDGSGYPGHLKGRAIPFFAQIIALSDVYDAIARKKPYGDAYGSFETLNIMMKEMGNQFDKKLLMEFIRFMGPQERT